MELANCGAASKAKSQNLFCELAFGAVMLRFIIWWSFLFCTMKLCVQSWNLWGLWVRIVRCEWGLLCFVVDTVWVEDSEVGLGFWVCVHVKRWTWSEFMYFCVFNFFKSWQIIIIAFYFLILITSVYNMLTMHFVYHIYFFLLLKWQQGLKFFNLQGVRLMRLKVRD